MLALIPAVARESRKYLEVAQGKAQREGGAMRSQQCAYNRFAIQVEQNLALNDILETKKISWQDHPEFINKLYQQIVDSQIYKDYMDSSEDSFDSDREVWRKLYRTLIENNEDIDSILEEESLYWNDDKEIVDTFVVKTIKRFDEKSGTKQAILPEYTSEEDRDFARKLFRAAILNADEYQHYMGEMSRNWDFNRLAFMDVVIMQIAIAEMMTFPGIPVNVTINEFVNIAKIYSTPRSGGYINGILDPLARKLVNSGRMLKAIPPRNKPE